MGFLDFLKPDKPKAQKASANEIALAQVAGLKDEEFVEDFMPLEAAEIAQWRNRAIEKTNKSLLAGRENADIALAEAQALGANKSATMASGMSLNSGKGLRGITDIGQETSAGVTAANVNAARGARTIRDAEGVAAVRTGQGMGRGVIQSLGTLASADNFRSAARIRAKADEKMALADALMSVGATAAFKAQDMGDERKRKAKAELPGTQTTYQTVNGQPFAFKSSSLNGSP